MKRRAQKGCCERVLYISFCEGLDMTLKLNRSRVGVAVCVVLLLLSYNACLAAPTSLGTQQLYAYNPCAPSNPWTLNLASSYDYETHVYTYSLENPQANSKYKYASHITDFSLSIDGLKASDITSTLVPQGWSASVYNFESGVSIQWTLLSGTGDGSIVPGTAQNFAFISLLTPSKDLNTFATASSFGGDTYGPKASEVSAVPEFSTAFSAIGILSGVMGPMLLRRKKVS